MSMQITAARPQMPTTSGARGAAPAQPVGPAGSGLPGIVVHDGSADGPVLQQSGGPTSSDPIAAQAYKTMQQVEQYYKTDYGRNGWDGKGTPLTVIAHQTNDDGSSMANAYWESDTEDIHIGDGGPIGKGASMKPLGGAADVLAHEFTHAVMQASGVQLGHSGQGGGLSESWADVIGTGIDHNWQIGASIMQGAPAIRDLSKPLFASVSAIPKTDNESHDLSSVPSFAAYQTAQKIGEDSMRQIWYRAMTGGFLKSGSRFSGAAMATEAAAASLYGANSTQEQAVADAWKSVGVTPSGNGARVNAALSATQASAGASAIVAGPLPSRAMVVGSVG